MVNPLHKKILFQKARLTLLSLISVIKLHHLPNLIKMEAKTTKAQLSENINHGITVENDKKTMLK